MLFVGYFLTSYCFLFSFLHLSSFLNRFLPAECWLWERLHVFMFTLMRFWFDTPLTSRGTAGFNAVRVQSRNKAFVMFGSSRGNPDSSVAAAPLGDSAPLSGHKAPTLLQSAEKWFVSEVCFSVLNKNRKTQRFLKTIVSGSELILEVWRESEKTWSWKFSLDLIQSVIFIWS